MNRSISVWGRIKDFLLLLDEAREQSSLPCGNIEVRQILAVGFRVLRTLQNVPQRHHKLNVRVLAHHMLEAESVDGFHLLRRERIRIRFVQIVIDISHRTFVVLANHAAHRRTSQHFAHRREGFQRSISWDDDELCLNSTTIKTSYVYLNRLVGFLQQIDVWLRENCPEVLKFALKLHFRWASRNCFFLIVTIITKWKFLQIKIISKILTSLNINW